MTHESLPFFVHIPKAAGSTVRALISLNYDLDRVLSVYGTGSDVVGTLAANAGKANRYDLVQGHMPYGSHYQLNVRNPRYFVFLREPVERMFSDIAFSIRTPYHGFHHCFAGPERTPMELLEIARGIQYYRNNMTNYISGLHFPSRHADLADLHRAIDNLWKSELVGLFSAFEESLLVMAKRLGWKKVVAERLNRSPPLAKIEITDDVRSAASSVLMLDHALYAAAQDIAGKQFAPYGDFLKEAAQQLREIYRTQSRLAPQREYDAYQVGDALELYRQLEATITPQSPLGRWIAGIAPVMK